MNKEQEKKLEKLKQRAIRLQSERTSILYECKEAEAAMQEYLSYYSEIKNGKMAEEAISRLGLVCANHQQSFCSKNKTFGNRDAGVVSINGSILSYGGQQIDFGSPELVQYFIDGLATKKEKPCLKLV